MELTKISPDVIQVIKPIIDDMSKIDLEQRMNANLGPHNEPFAVKEIKKSCVHVIWTGRDFQIAVKRVDDKLICTACGREICQKFDKSSVDAIMNAIPVVNQVLFFGMLHGMKAEPIQTLISLKRTLPAVAQLASELNDYVSKSDKASEALDNIGAEYNTPQLFSGITSM
jgi:hypothetical protein